jgi:NitT/TauT family transport system permease protein
VGGPAARGFGDRRFVRRRATSAVRFWQLTLNGELFAHTGRDVLRAAAGFVIGVVPAIAIGLLMAMSRPVRIFFDPLIAALFPIRRSR